MEIINTVLLIVIVAGVLYLIAKTNHKTVTRSGAKPVFVDTSVLIDGRIVTIARTGFLPGTLMIPRSVIGELQYMADNADNEKRARARHGLDVIAELQNIDGIDVKIHRDSSRAEEGVDERLLNLAKKYKGIVCTNDYNLNKVALVENIRVLNVNDLTMGLRMSYLPGEKMMIELKQKGHEKDQGIGHLADGTMVVVEKAGNKVGTNVEIEFIRSLQTAAGKMMFAKLVGAVDSPRRNVQADNSKSYKTRRNYGNRSASEANRTQPKKRVVKSKSEYAEQNFVDLANK